MIDDKLWEVDKNIILAFDVENKLSISGEGYKSIKLIGGASSFFYDYYLGTGAGIVFGKSDLSGKLDIIAGSNNQFTFRIDDSRYTVNFPPTPYPPYVVMDILRNSL
jgi:flagellin